MKKYTICLIFLIISLIVVSSAFAEEKRKTNRYSGDVREVNIKEKTVTVGIEKRALAMLFHASNATFVNVGSLKDLKIGDKVVVDYDAIKGKTLAVTVTKEQKN